jgi:hypothetical protein
MSNVKVQMKLKCREIKSAKKEKFLTLSHFDIYLVFGF